MACSAYKYYSNLGAKFGDQFYLFDRTCLIENIHMFKTAFSSAYSRVTMSHSYKTNYTPEICKIAQKEGLHAEVVSGEEYDIALQVGYSPEEIIFNGPIKKYGDLENALLQGSMVNVDHLEETRQVVAISTEHPETRIKIGIRCNADFGSPLRSRFGMSEDHGELQAAFELRKSLGFRTPHEVFFNTDFVNCCTSKLNPRCHPPRYQWKND